MNKTNNKWLSVIVAFALCLPLSLFAYSGGDGSYENPYQVASTEDWELLCSDVNLNGNNQSGVYFIQTADIVFGEGYTWEMYRCGLPSALFKGNYDGDGYYFSNLFITATLSSTATTNAFGLFGYCEEATIENVSVYGRINVLADYNANACVGVGGVIGISVKGLFASLHNYCDIDVKISNSPTGQGSTQNIKYGVGGVLGLNAWTTNSGTLHIGCENYGSVYVDGANGNCSVGGCFTANVPDSGTDTTFSGWNNYGKIVVSGTTESKNYYCSCVGGVGSTRGVNTHTTRTPQITSCSNFGDLVCSNSVNVGGVAAKGNSTLPYTRIQANTSTNYASVVMFNNVANGRVHIGGVLVDLTQNSGVARGCVNYGKITASGSGTGIFQLGGVYSGINGAFALSSHSDKNFGNIEAVLPNATSVVASGIMATEGRPFIYNSVNYGNINIQTEGSVLIGGAASLATQSQGSTLLRNVVNFGNITASGNSNTNYSPSVGGVFASTRQVGDTTREITISNCYFIGTAKLNLNNDTCYGAIYGVANTYGNYSVSIKNCYAIVGEGQNLIGAVDASNGQVSLENCVGIKSGREGGIAYSVIGSNNWSQVGTTLASYDDCYTNPYQCYGNMGSGIFTPADKTTNFFDLILPINTQLYPTPSAEDKKNHNYTKAQGYKRYIRTIQQ